VVANLAGVALPPALPPYLASPLNLLFGFGVVARALSRRAGGRFAAPLALFGAAAFIGVGMEAVYVQRLPEAASQLAFGAAAAVGLAAVVALERARAVAVPKLLLLLGAASYAIYLTHFPLLSLLAKIAVATGIRDAWPPQLGFIVLVVVAVALGVAFHLLVEKPLLRLASRALAPRQASPSNAVK